jgi:hypothetical protein
MRKRHAAWVGALTLASSMALAAGGSDPPASSQVSDDALETVLVTGEQPGPGLWKVSKDDHFMWILGTYGPLPKNMRWRSRDVESLIGESQEVLYSGGTNVRADIGLFRALTLIPAMLRAGKNPNDAKLKDVLPTDVYAKWLVLKERYMGHDEGVERWRPTFALGMLRGAAIKKSGLVYSATVESPVNKAAKQHNVPMHRLPTATRKVEIEDPRDILRNARNAELPDVECFSRSLDRLESDIITMKARANAWATGDLASLRDLNRPVQAEKDCNSLLMNALSTGSFAGKTGMRKVIEDAKTQAALAEKESEETWLAAAQAALAGNRTTFAVLAINDLVRPAGYVVKLRALGYTVDEP